MRISDIIHREEYILSEIDDKTEIKGLKTDPSELCEGDLLIIPGSGNLPDFTLARILPLAVICSPEVILPKDIPSIRVSNPRLAFANAFYRFEGVDTSGIKLIGITGTNGKTTTASLIKHILCTEGYKVGFIGTGKIESGDNVLSGENYSMTTPDPPLLYRSIKTMVDDGCEAIVMEVSSHALALDKVSPLCFDYGVFTNLSSEHIDFHKDMAGYFKAKQKLFGQSKCSVFNIDDEYGKRAYSMCNGKKISGGIVWQADVWGSNIKRCGLDGIEYTYHGDGFSFKMKLPLPGLYNSYNSMLAATVCIDMGLAPCRVKRALSHSRSVAGRFEIIRDKITVVIDYAHTSAALDSILKELCKIKGSKGLTVVFGCGGNRDKTKRPKMASIAEKYADRIIVTSDNSRKESTKDIISDIISGFNKGSYEIKENREEAIIAAVSEAKDLSYIILTAMDTVILTKEK